jgi:hypothetical protein
MDKIAIVYLCTGNYVIFEKDFYSSAERFFMPNVSKDYFIFTDKLDEIEKRDNKYLQYQSQSGWPYDVLVKWECICRIQKLLQPYEYIALCNANMKFVSETIIPNFESDFVLTGFLKDKDSYEFETSRRSHACIKDIFSIERYIQTGFIVGKAEAFLKAAVILKEWTERDLKKKFIPIWHDESYFNAYIYNLHIQKITFWDYDEIIPGDWVNDKNREKVKAVFQDKMQFGGHDSLRNHQTTLWETKKRNIKRWIVKKKIRRRIRNLMGKKS